MKHAKPLVAIAFASLALALAPATQPSPEQQAAIAKANPDMQEVLNAFLDLNPKPIEMLTPAQARKQPTLGDAAVNVMTSKGIDTSPEKVGDVGNRKIDVGDRKIPVRVYTPEGDGPFPVLVYFHGGGFVIADLDTYDASCRALTNLAKCVVVSVGYREAPEYKWPAAHDDAYLATQWVFAHAADIKGDAARIAVGGESAGGNLATATALRLKDNHAPLPVAQLLVYPVTNDTMDTESYAANTGALPLNKAMMRWFFGNYATSPTDGGNKYLCPLKAEKSDLAGLPPAIVITAAIDPLMTEGKQYAEKLRAAGVSVAYQNFDGVTHEFFGLGKVVAAAKQAEGFAGSNLKNAFSGAAISDGR